MGTLKIYTKALKEEILNTIQVTGKPVLQIAEEYGISSKTIYYWLRNGITRDNTILEVRRLKRENEELKKLVGELILGLKKRKDRYSKKS